MMVMRLTCSCLIDTRWDDVLIHVDNAEINHAVMVHEVITIQLRGMTLMSVLKVSVKFNCGQ